MLVELKGETLLIHSALGNHEQRISAGENITLAEIKRRR